MRRQSLHLHARSIRNMSSAVVDGIFSQVFSQIRPSTTNADHDAFAVFTHRADEQLRRVRLSAPVQMVQLHGTFLGAVCMCSPTG